MAKFFLKTLFQSLKIMFLVVSFLPIQLMGADDAQELPLKERAKYVVMTPEEKEKLKTLEKKVLITSLTNRENKQLERLIAKKKEAKLFKNHRKQAFQTVGAFGKREQDKDKSIILRSEYGKPEVFVAE